MTLRPVVRLAVIAMASQLCHSQFMGKPLEKNYLFHNFFFLFEVFLQKR